MSAKAARQPALLVLTIALSFAACRQREDAPPATSEPPLEAPAPLAIRPATDAVDATDTAVAKANQQIAASAAAMREHWRGKTFEEFEASVFKEPGADGKYIIDGDIPIPDRKLLEEFFAQLQGVAEPTQNPLVVDRIGIRLPGGVAALVVNRINGRPDIWDSGKKKALTYCVSTAFGSRHAAVVADMAAATQAWEQAANVDFLHVPAQDGQCTSSNQNVVFDVRPVNVNGQYLARAFFPNDQRAARNVLVDGSSFQLDPLENLKLVGILRHELGHTLGWRHEHTRPESGTCFEDSDFQPLTSYDRFSVMHYPHCNGGGDWSLALTALDKTGSACIYGKGSNNTEDLAPCVFQIPAAPVASSATIASFPGQSIAKGDSRRYPVFAVRPGSLFEARISGAGNSPGDPDLYVQFNGQPEVDSWICRPFLSHAAEACELQVPANGHTAEVMVRGYTAASYHLEVKHVQPD